MLNDITIYGVLAGVSLAGIIVIGLAAGFFMNAKKESNPESYRKTTRYVKIIDFALFLVMGFSLIPVLVKVFTDLLPQVINNPSVTRTVQENGMFIVYGIWVILVAGVSLALPAMHKSGFFSEEPGSGSGSGQP